MRKGQVFILIAFIIAMMLAELGNLYTYSALPAQAEQAKTVQTVDILKNIHNEMQYLDNMNKSDQSRTSDFQMFVGNFTRNKNYITNFTVTDSP